MAACPRGAKTLPWAVPRILGFGVNLVVGRDQGHARGRLVLMFEGLDNEGEGGFGPGVFIKRPRIAIFLS